MKILQHSVECSIREKGSKFLGFLFPCTNDSEFSERLNQLKSKYPDASHHCYAWRLDPNDLREYSSDAGEPSGTAGLPILNQLKSADVINIGAVVVRYFGGTKLGKAGLIGAYGTTINECLNMAQFKSIIPVQIFEISYPYNEENLINRLQNTYSFKVLDSNYSEKVDLKIACPAEWAKTFEKDISKREHLGISCIQQAKSFI